MRHFLFVLALPVSVGRLPSGVLAAATSRLLIATSGLAQAPLASRLPARPAAVALATVTPRAHRHRLPATLAEESATIRA
jgi:hypothetical protein